MAVAGQPDQSGITRLLSTINSLMSPGGKRGGVRGGEEGKQREASRCLSCPRIGGGAGEPPASDGTFNPTHPAAEASRQREAHTERGGGRGGGGEGGQGASPVGE